MTILLTLLLQLAPTGQEGAAASGWRTLNRPEVTVNEDILTTRRIDRQLARARQVQPVSTPDEELRLKADIVRGAVEELALRQAGEDLGQPKEAVERVLDNVWNNQIERSGSIHKFSMKLESEEEDSIQKRSDLEAELYTWTYTRVITGHEPGKDGRLIADRYVRPGERRRLFDGMARTGQALGQIGGRPASFVLQQLVLERTRDSDPVALRTLAEELRQRALAGEDFHALVNAHGARKGAESLSGDISADTLARLGPELAEFAQTAKVGDISPVSPVRDFARGRVEGWRVVRVLEARPGEVPSFDDLEVQRRIELVAQRRLDELRRAEALQRLLRSAYVWSPALERAERAEREAAAESAGEAPPPPPEP